MTTRSTCSACTASAAPPARCSPACSRSRAIGDRAPPGLLEGNARQVLIQLYGIGATLVWSGVLTFVLLKVIGFLVPLRVTRAGRVEGPRHHPARRSAAVAHDRPTEPAGPANGGPVFLFAFAQIARQPDALRQFG